METTLTKSGYVTQIVRSYTDQKDTGDKTLPLAAIWFGAHREGVGWRDNPVKIKRAMNSWCGQITGTVASLFCRALRSSGRPPRVPWSRPSSKSPRFVRPGAGPSGLGNKENIERIAKLRAAGGEAAAKGGASSPDSTVVRYCLSVLETMPPKKSDEPFANQLRALRADASRPIVVRLTANRLLPGYAAAPEKARADAAQWPRTIFSTSKADSDLDLRTAAKEIMAGFSKERGPRQLFLAIMADETKPRPVRMASVSALVDEQCFDFKQPASPVASRVFSALLFLLNSKDGELRKVRHSMPQYVSHRITSRPDQVMRASEATSALNAAIDVERDEGVLAFMKAYRWHLENLLKAPPPPLLTEKELRALKSRQEKKARETRDNKGDTKRPEPPPASAGPESKPKVVATATIEGKRFFGAAALPDTFFVLVDDTLRTTPFPAPGAGRSESPGTSFTVMGAPRSANVSTSRRTSTALPPWQPATAWRS